MKNKPKPPLPPTDYAFLDMYDVFVKGLYLKIIEYKGSNKFTIMELASDNHFKATLTDLNAKYKEWCAKDQEGNGRYAMWSFDDRWKKFFNRMLKLKLISVDWSSQLDEEVYNFSHAHLQADIDENKIMEARKELFLLQL